MKVWAIDAAAEDLLAKSSDSLPRRAAPSAGEARALVVTACPALAFAPLRTLDRVVEMAGTTLLMAVPERAALEAEALENAVVWIAGGAEAAKLREQGGRALLCPGDSCQGGTRLELHLEHARLVGAGGQVLEALRVDLKPRSRLSVQGA
jgi:hypothetical protein